MSNIIEDTIEAIVGFSFRFVYTTCLLFFAPRSIVFHILTHNRELRITRPYSFFFASFLLFTAAFTISLVYGSTAATILEHWFGQSDTFREVLNNPSVVAFFASFAPTLFGILIAAWLIATPISAILVSIRRMRRYLKTTYYGLVYFVALHFLVLGTLPIIETALRAVVAPPPTTGGGMLGPGFLYYESYLIVPTFLLLLLIMIALWRFLSAFQLVTNRRIRSRNSRIAHTFISWVFVNIGLYLSVALAAVVTTAIYAVEVRLNVDRSEPPGLDFSCVSTRTLKHSVFIGVGPALEFPVNSDIPTFMQQKFDFLLVNNGGNDIDLSETVKLWGLNVICSNVTSIDSCRRQQCDTCKTLLGEGRIIEPESTAGMIIIPKGEMTGIRVEVQDLNIHTQKAQFVSAPSFELRSVLVPGLNQMPGRSCEPFHYRSFIGRFPR